MARSREAPLKQKVIAYRYEALNAKGRLVKGTVRAVSEMMAEQVMIEKGLRTISMEVQPSMLSLEQAFPSLFAIKPREVIVFSRQLATLLQAGISLLPALDLIRGQAAGSRGFVKVLNVVIDDIRTGSAFSQAIDRHPKVFSEVYRRTLAVGERTGNIEYILRQLADYQEKQGQIAKKLGKALTYPAVIMSVSVVVIVILLTVALPPMVEMFTNMNVDLPLPTRILIGTSDFMGAYKLYVLVVGIVGAAFLVWFIKQPAGRRFFDRVRLTMPVLGPPVLMAELGRFSRTLSVLVGAGISLQEIMELVPQTTSNSVFRDALSEVRHELLLGHGIAGPMARNPLFPPLMVQMVTVGEESNTLDSTMGVVADFYETTAEEKMNAMVGIITPLSTVVIALFVGFIALAIIVPMYSLTGSF